MAILMKTHGKHFNLTGRYEKYLNQSQCQFSTIKVTELVDTAHIDQVVQTLLHLTLSVLSRLF